MTGGEDRIAKAVREKAYAIWEARGRPDGQADEHWRQAEASLRREQHADSDTGEDEEKLIEGRFDLNYPALLTKDVPGG